MHPLQLHYAGGRDYALASFGLEKIAIMSPEQRGAFMRERASRPKGLAAVQGASGDAELAQMKPSAGPTPLSLGAAPTAPMEMQQGFGGGPGMAQGFGGGGLPLVDPRAASRSQQSLQPGAGDLRDSLLPQAMPGRQTATEVVGGGKDSIAGAAANAERMRKPLKPALPNKLAAFLLQ